MTRPLYSALLVLATCSAMAEPPATTRAATAPARPEPVEFRMRGPRAATPALKWSGTDSGLSLASAQRPMRITITDPGGKQIHFDAVNVVADAADDQVRNVSARPPWPLDTKPGLARRIERQLADWGAPVNNRQRKQLADMAAAGDQPPPPYTMFEGCNGRLTKETSLGVRIGAVAGKGWYAVFEFGSSEPTDEERRELEGRK